MYMAKTSGKPAKILSAAGTLTSASDVVDLSQRLNPSMASPEVARALSASD
jgi:hypothetical protein